jgi:ribA/ribD-fused uncharacterized protein
MSNSRIITFFRENEAYGEFSNFSKHPILYAHPGYDGDPEVLKEYPTSEHAYQALKFDYPGASEASRAYAEIIRKTNTPYKAKLLGHQKLAPRNSPSWRLKLDPTIRVYQRVKPDPKWEESKYLMMVDILVAKFTQHENLRDLLLNTNDAIIQEDNPYDDYWSIGKDGSGLNMLGQALMVVREAIRNMDEDS